MALETASEGKFDINIMEASSVPPQYEKLKVTWEGFIDSMMREWKTFNIISVLLLSAILTILQIDAAAADPVTRYAALFSLICALMSLLFGCMYIIRFGGMRKTYKAAEWALEAKKTKTIIWWNVWVLLAMPVVWLTWSIVLYLVCIMSFIWRTSSADSAPPQPLSPGGLLAVRIVLTVVLGLGVVYSVLIILTFRRYGEAMDRQWKERIDGWLEEKSLHIPIFQSAGGYNGVPEPQPVNSNSPPPPSSPLHPPQRAPSYVDHGYGYSYSADVKSRYGDLGAPAYSSIPLKDPFARPGSRQCRHNYPFNTVEYLLQHDGHLPTRPLDGSHFTASRTLLPPDCHWRTAIASFEDAISFTTNLRSCKGHSETHCITPAKPTDNVIDTSSSNPRR
ncbi:hypothetical protein CPB83DRAFT_507209 [Crepidotus variabilis]|uniref:Uncharacterized protein n=1 Tax=Crepidotus variabilis TaxID=179855 RepID=A0A9P6EBR8_9AGAR|nr:hypothetical protein CPB83DRAFT_507209 [Crepidotus variabilis]